MTSSWASYNLAEYGRLIWLVNAVGRACSVELTMMEFKGHAQRPRASDWPKLRRQYWICSSLSYVLFYNTKTHLKIQLKRGRVADEKHIQVQCFQDAPRRHLEGCS